VRACAISKAPIWDGSALTGKFPTWSEIVVRGYDSMPPSKTISTTKNPGRNYEIGNKNHKKTTDTNIFVIEVGTGHLLQLVSKNPTTKNVKKIPTLKQWRHKVPIRNEEDQVMGELEEFFIHSLIENLITVQPGDKGLEEGEGGCNTPKKKLTFDLPRGNDGKFQGKWVDANPFETLMRRLELQAFSRKPWKHWMKVGLSKERRSTRSK